MSVLSIGLLYGGATLLVMFSGMPIAFALGAVATLFMIIFMPRGSVDTIAQNVYEEMASITLLSIPLFILKGAAIGRSPAGRDPYHALHAWMHWIPGGPRSRDPVPPSVFFANGRQSELLRVDTLTVYDKFALLPRVLPFVILLTGVMIALYGGYATPSETAGLGAVLALALIASIYSVWTPHDLEPILMATLRE